MTTKYYRSGNIRDILIFGRRPNSRIQESRENENSATKKMIGDKMVVINFESLYFFRNRHEHKMTKGDLHKLESGA